MTGKEIITKKLEDEVLFRERKNKDKGIANIVAAHHWGIMQALKDGYLTIESLANALQEYASLDRCWRKILEERQELRGSDYDDKDELERRKLEELGYNVSSGESDNQNKLL